MGPGNAVGAHAVVEGRTTLGAGNRIFAHAVVGAPPQDLKYRGEDTRLEMGDGNVVREFASIHTGTVGGGGVTRLANQCLIMASAHVAHDCLLGDRRHRGHLLRAGRTRRGRGRRPSSAGSRRSSSSPASGGSPTSAGSPA